MLYYSHVNEDNRVERTILRNACCKTIVSVAGSGERVLALMDEESCSDIEVVDVNPEALYLLELKLTALEFLYVEEYLAFIGHYPASVSMRREWFERIREKLSYRCRCFWLINSNQVEKGILNMGHFEKFLRRVRKPVNFFLGSKFKEVIRQGYNSKTFPAMKWNMICRLFSVRFVYKIYGNRDVAFTGKDASINYIPKAITQTIQANKAPSSFMMHLVFQGHLRDMNEKDLPPSLNRVVLSRIKQRLAEKQLTVRYHVNDLLTYTKKHAHKLATPVFYSASDLLSFEDYSYMHELLETTGSRDSLVVWRAFLRNRAGNENARFNQPVYKNTIDHSAYESTGMYQVFSLENHPMNAGH
jgi:S-adenosylmethionine:diacylglycerol 3-amino-3-carboxypropyl transferase